MLSCRGGLSPPTGAPGEGTMAHSDTNDTYIMLVYIIFNISKEYLFINEINISIIIYKFEYIFIFLNYF